MGPTTIALPSDKAIALPPRRTAAVAQRCAQTIRVVTYNIWGGRRWAEVRQALEANPADIVCLQEVIPDHRGRPETWATAERIASELGGSWQYETLWRIVTRPIGNMTLSRGRVGAAEPLKVSFSEPYGMVTPVEIDGAVVTVANLHLAPLVGPPPIGFAPTEVQRWREMRDLRRRFARHNRPLIVAGDFNSFRFAPAYGVAARQWRDCRRAAGGRHAATRPTYGLPFVIDHVFVSEHFRVLDYHVADGTGSDHRLVAATLELPPS